MKRLVPLLLLLAACSAQPAPAIRPPLAGARIGGPFALTDQHGARVTDASFAGRYRIVYFGYTYCPDVCPRDMAVIGAGLRLLARQDADLARRVVPVFISVDPARDTPAVLGRFVSAFSPRAVGLTGSPEAIAAVAKAYGVYFRKGGASPGGGYMVDHSDVTYLMGPAGEPLALLPASGTPEALVAELRRWAR